MPREFYNCTTAELATHSVELLSIDSSPSDAAAWLAENGSDAVSVSKPH